MALNAYHVTALGHTPVMDRTRIAGPIQEGVESRYNSYRVVKGSGFTLLVYGRTNGAAGMAYVPSTTGGLYMVRETNTSNSVTISTAHSTLPRIDALFLTVNETTAVATYNLVAGTATAGAQISTPGISSFDAGVPATPASSIRLANILVPAGATSSTSVSIADRRLSCRGAFQYKIGGFVYTPPSAQTTLLTAEVMLSGKAPVQVLSNSQITPDSSLQSTNMLHSITYGTTTTTRTNTFYFVDTITLSRPVQTLFTPVQAGYHRFNLIMQTTASGGASHQQNSHLLVRELLTRSVTT
jgi:hypothetical protein